MNTPMIQSTSKWTCSVSNSPTSSSLGAHRCCRLWGLPPSQKWPRRKGLISASSLTYGTVYVRRWPHINTMLLENMFTFWLNLYHVTLFKLAQAHCTLHCHILLHGWVNKVRALIDHFLVAFEAEAGVTDGGNGNLRRWTLRSQTLDMLTLRLLLNSFFYPQNSETKDDLKNQIEF